MIGLIVCLIIFGSFTWGLVSAARRKHAALVHALDDPAMRPQIAQSIHGHRYTTETMVMTSVGSDVENRRGNLNELQLRTRVEGVLPPWVAFGWSPSFLSGEVSDRGSLWMDILAGRGLLSTLPAGCNVYSEDGALIFESAVSQTPTGSEAFLALVSVLLTAAPDLIAELEKRALKPSGLKRILAIRVLIDRLRDHEATRRVLEACFESRDLELNAIAAASSPDYEGNRPKLIEIADDPFDLGSARAIAVRALIDHADDDALFSLKTHPVPEAVRIPYVERLRRRRDAHNEALAIGYLKSDAKDAAISVLAVIGGRESISALRALKDADIEAALEMILARLKATIGETSGALSVTGQSSEGQLSFANKAGAISVPED